MRNSQFDAVSITCSRRSSCPTTSRTTTSFAPCRKRSLWDEEEPRHLRARLDALYFYLYGMSRDAAEYVLDTFPIVRREDAAAFGTYRTRDMTLAYMNALAAGDTEAVVAV